MSGELRWFKARPAGGVWESLPEGFVIERGWRWSDRHAASVPDGWEAYSGSGPTRRLLGERYRLAEAKELCQKRALTEKGSRDG